MQEQTEVVSWSGPVNGDLSDYNGLLVLLSVCPKFQCPRLQSCKYVCVLCGTCSKLLGKKVKGILLPYYFCVLVTPSWFYMKAIIR